MRVFILTLLALIAFQAQALAHGPEPHPVLSPPEIKGSTLSIQVASKSAPRLWVRLERGWVRLKRSRQKPLPLDGGGFLREYLLQNYERGDLILGYRTCEHVCWTVRVRH